MLALPDIVKPGLVSAWRASVLALLLALVGCVNNPDYIALEDTGRGLSTASNDQTRSAQTRRETPVASDQKPAQRPGIYRVEKGDTLYSIAFRYSRDFRDLAAANDIEPPYLIVPGQTIDTRARVTTEAGNTERSRSTKKAETSTGESATGTKANTSKPKTPAPATPESRGTPGDLDWIWPVQGDVTSRFSEGASGTKGIDISADLGTRVQAAAPGRVVYAGDGLRGYGNLIILEHPGRVLSAYAFTDNIQVAEQEEVRQGDPIADVGDRGGDALLHFEIRTEGKPVDPLTYLP